MSMHSAMSKVPQEAELSPEATAFMASYLDGLTLVERLHRLLLDVIKDEFERSEIDRRSVRVRLTQKGRDIRLIVAKLFATHADGLINRGVLDQSGMDDITSALRRMERYWTEQIRYIY